MHSGASMHIYISTRRPLLVLFALTCILFLFWDVIIDQPTIFGGKQLVACLLSGFAAVTLYFDHTGRTCGRLLLAGSATFVTLFALEVTYRVMLAFNVDPTTAASDFRYSVTPQPYYEFDKAHGHRFIPNAELFATYVQAGKVVLGMTINKSNIDGLGGATTIAEYNDRDFKLLVFGDSFSHWNQQGRTWPDILEDTLNEQLDVSVGVLNYARGGYGLIQMLALAAEKVPEHTPDLIVIAAIGGDFKRARCWDKVFYIDGERRWIKSSRSDVFDDYRFAIDMILIDNRATNDWCGRLLEDNSPSARDRRVLANLNSRFARLRAEVYAVRRGLDLFSLDRSYLFSRVRNGYPYPYRPQIIPNVPFDDFSEDEGTVLAVDKLKRSEIPIALIYLPLKDEIVEKRCLANDKARRLMRSLEEMLEQSFVHLEAKQTRKMPEKIDLRPFDGHPNFDGLRWYALEVAEVVSALHAKLWANQLSRAEAR